MGIGSIRAAMISLVTATVLVLTVAPTRNQLHLYTTRITTELPQEFIMKEFDPVLEPTAPGIRTTGNDDVLLDYSNANKGYVQVLYTGKSDGNIRVIIETDGSAPHTYWLDPEKGYNVYPLSQGDGEYRIGVHIRRDGIVFLSLYTATIDVVLEDEFAPFLHPSMMVNFNQNSMVVRKAQQLTWDSATHYEKIVTLYEWVAENITYDFQLADTVQSGYIPNPDTVFVRGQGICYDYAVLLVAMLRSLHIPAQLVMGYANGAYHAWVNVYRDDMLEWQRLDPTFASAARSGVSLGGMGSVMEYIELFRF
jgi:transglutaminase-like putative cysteine protease